LGFALLREESFATRRFSIALESSTSHEKPHRLTKAEKKSGLEETYSAKTFREEVAEAQSMDAIILSKSLIAAY
jgi:hypothetical protein